MRRTGPVLAALLVSALLAGCVAGPGLDEAVVPLTAAERALLPAGEPATVRFDFDAALPSLRPQSAGPTAELKRLDLHLRTAAAGDVRFVASPHGRAARFPHRCTPETAACPRAILEAGDAALLNPRRRPVRFGAVLRMTAADAGAGANVLQKGFSTGPGAQYKLQVDGVAGRPSCVVSVNGDIHKLESPVAVIDGAWHAVACTVSAGKLLINVDGTVTTLALPDGVDLHNDQPLRVGGKSVAPQNDQFAGEIDDVFVSIYGQ